MTTVPLFVELCAGTAALSLRLHKDGARPPVSRMGAKTGYADAILRVLGLYPGQRAERYLWCEPDPGVRLLLHAYRDAGLAKAAAAIIRGWKDEDPRALWVRLREEGPPRLPDGEVDAGEVARWVRIVTSNPLIPVHHDGVKWCNSARNTPGAPTKGGISFGGDFCRPIDALANGLDTTLSIPAIIATDAIAIDPREVARVIQIMASNTLINVAWNDAEGRWKNTGRGGTTFGGPIGYGANRSPAKIDGLPEMPALVHPDARTIDLPQLPPGTVAYMDPPYVGTTPYAHDLPRAEVVTLAHRWASAGATVCISEAEPIPELVAEGWHTIRIDGERSGVRRVFSKQQAEWLTINRAPAWAPPKQGRLFGF